MSCWAIVAIKTRAQCKRRLEVVLDAAARVDLARHMLNHVLHVAGASRSVDRVLVVSPERDTVAESIPVVSDTGDGLNAALELARSTACAAGAREIVVLPADLPGLSIEDLDAIIALGRRSGGAIACDRAGHGTNGLYLGSDVPLGFSFGHRSLQAHVGAARACGLELPVLRRSGFEFDVDTPADLHLQANANLLLRPSRQWAFSNAGP